MKTDITDLRSTIVPRADQTNSEELLGGPRTITITDVRAGNDEQPLIIDYQGDNGRPFKPSKTVRKILVFAWGADGREWIGRSMTIYNDPTVKFGGELVGGIRVSHLTHIDKAIQISLTATKGKKAPWRIEPLVMDTGPTVEEVVSAIDAAHNRATMDEAKAMIGQLAIKIDQDVAIKAYNQRAAALRAAAKAATPAEPTE